MISEISNKIEANRFLMALRRFFMSKLCVGIQLFIAMIIVVLSMIGVAASGKRLFYWVDGRVIVGSYASTHTDGHGTGGVRRAGG